MSAATATHRGLRSADGTEPWLVAGATAAAELRRFVG